ncbi:MAG: hypothetical protein AB1716_11000 [Planctomycetota bacterium]
MRAISAGWVPLGVGVCLGVLSAAATAGSCPAGPAAQMPSTQPARPAWTWAEASGIEWAVVVPARGERAGVLVAARDGRLQLLDIERGERRLMEPIVAGRGVAFAGYQEAPHGPSAFCFDRYAAYAIRLCDPPGLAWQFGRPADPREVFPGDPEALAGWQAGAPLAGGLLLVERDGTVLLLEGAASQAATSAACPGGSDTGEQARGVGANALARVRWRVRGAPLPLVQLHVRGDEAALLSKSAGRMRALFVAARGFDALRMDGVESAPNWREIDGAWPLWGTLAAEGLILGYADGFAVWPRAGPAVRRAFSAGGIAANAVDVCEIDGRSRVIVMEGPQPAAYDVWSGALVWPSAAADSDCRSGRPRVGSNVGTSSQTCSVRCLGRRVVVRTAALAAAYDSETGELVACVEAPPGAEMLSAHVADDYLFALYASADSGGSEPRAAGAADTSGARRAAKGLAYVPLRTSREARQPARTIQPLEGPPGPCDTLWAADRVVLASRDALRAYRLPRQGGCAPPAGYNRPASR